jgi:3-deoxy-7-phosphoheptulonate synthase
MTTQDLAGPGGVAVLDTPLSPIEQWRARPADQQPDWPDPVELRDVVAELAACPPLVDARECDRLRDRLAVVARGEAFLLQGGDCAELFDEVTAEAVHGKVRMLSQMAAVLAYGASKPVVRVGRIAGQYAKPRSRPFETVDGRTLPVYRGDAVNGRAFTERAREADPRRLRRMYEASATTLNLIRMATATGGAGGADLRALNRAFAASTTGRRHRRLTGEIDRALGFLGASGVSPATLGAAEQFTSHEGLLLDYETALTRLDPLTGRHYATSGHLVWIGERTRALTGAHVDYFTAIANPIGVKLGPTARPDDVLALIDKLDPAREPGRLTFITRMGADQVHSRLPDIVDRVSRSGSQVVWVCDPMHGNTFSTASGVKTRHVEDVLAEIAGFFAVHRALGTHAGGIHLELTGAEVTECVGGGTTVEDLASRYESACDPRLNRSQSLELAYRVADLMR